MRELEKERKKEKERERERERDTIITAIVATYQLAHMAILLKLECVTFFFLAYLDVPYLFRLCLVHHHNQVGALLTLINSFTSSVATD